MSQGRYARQQVNPLTCSWQPSAAACALVARSALQVSGEAPVWARSALCASSTACRDRMMQGKANQGEGPVECMPADCQGVLSSSSAAV